jgi:carbonic anhydrase
MYRFPPTGLALWILSVFYIRQPRPWFKAAERLMNYKDSIDEPITMTFRDIIGASEFGVYHYEGSLTTPNCNEAVLWLVYSSLVPIMPAELALMQKVKDEKGKPIMKNNRPPQPMGSRSLKYYV